MARLIRMQMLYRPEQREALQEYAREHNISVTEAARRALDAGLNILQENDEFSKRKLALKKIKNLHDEMLSIRGGKPLDIDFVEDLRKLREERLEQIAGGT
jgi:hypothetical protein